MNFASTRAIVPSKVPTFDSGKHCYVIGQQTYIKAVNSYVKLIAPDSGDITRS